MPLLPAEDFLIKKKKAAGKTCSLLQHTYI
jgi:hypothetical protein